jgi:hypothetical protein
MKLDNTAEMKRYEHDLDFDYTIIKSFRIALENIYNFANGYYKNYVL